MAVVCIRGGFSGVSGSEVSRSQLTAVRCSTLHECDECGDAIYFTSYLAPRLQQSYLQRRPVTGTNFRCIWLWPASRITSLSPCGSLTKS